MSHMQILTVPLADVPGKASASENLPHLSLFSVWIFFGLTFPLWYLIFQVVWQVSIRPSLEKNKGKVNSNGFSEAVKIIQLWSFLALQKDSCSATNSVHHIYWPGCGKFVKIQALGYSACFKWNKYRARNDDVVVMYCFVQEKVTNVSSDELKGTEQLVCSKNAAWNSLGNGLKGRSLYTSWWWRDEALIQCLLIFRWVYLSWGRICEHPQTYHCRSQGKESSLF